MDILAGLLVVTLGAAFAALVVSPRTARSLDSFAAGFLPYRSAGWPQGVQEEDPVPWSWSATGDPAHQDGSLAGRDGPELIEFTRGNMPAITAVDPGKTVRSPGP